VITQEVEPSESEYVEYVQSLEVEISEYVGMLIVAA
jgi:hypothetical protein